MAWSAEGQASAVEQAAARLWDAQAQLTPCAPVRDLIPAGEVETAYAVQTMITDRHRHAGRRPVGWKVGLTSRAVQQQLGVDQPDFGILWADTEALDDAPLSGSSLLQPKVEAEVAFVLEHDLAERPVTAVDVIRSTAFVLPAIEIVASRITDWDITIVDTVADNASAGAFVVGANPRRLADVDLRDLEMSMVGPDGVVSTGRGSACLGHPVNAVVWLANTLLGLGQPLRAGDLILSGALGPMVAAAHGGVYEAVLEGFGSVRARFDAS